jgi:uncharacterized protein
MSDKSARDWALLVHLSALSGLVIPLGNLLGPILFWLLKKDESAFVDRHGRAAVNFQISVILYVLIFFAALLVIGVATLGIGFILLLPIILLGAVAGFILLIVLPILAGIKAQNGEEYTYPLSLTLLK